MDGDPHVCRRPRVEAAVARCQEATSQAHLSPPSVILACPLSPDLSFLVYCSPAVSGASRKQSVC